jgi:N-methylhydantoinase A
MESMLRKNLDKEVFVTRSSELSPVNGEYERTAATLINSLTGPTISQYITEIDEGLTEWGYEGTLLVMNVGGGLTPANEIVGEPIKTIDSGPVAGIKGSQYLGSLLDYQNILAADMGGTSFDVGLITDGEPINNSTNIIRQYAYSIRNINVESIGSGGGSIAWVDDVTTRLRIGPQSAGADPGPACYDRGGGDPTITDADLLCGFLDPEKFLGGRESLVPERSQAVIEEIADDLGVGEMEATKGIIEIANAKMGDLIERQTLKSGYDPREFTVFAYGGAGPLHLPMIAKQLEVGDVLVPTGDASSVWSAVGISSTDVMHRKEVSNIRTFAPFDPNMLTERFNKMESEIQNQLHEEGFDDDEITIERYANLRYGLQIHEVAVPVPDGKLTEEAMSQVIERFEKEYEKRYGEDAGAEETGYALVTVRCDGYGSTTKPNLEMKPESVQTVENTLSEEVYWPSENRYLETPIYEGQHLNADLEIEGPGLIRLRNTTVSIPQESRGSVDKYNNIRISTTE